MAKSALIVKGENVRHDPKTDYICLTDLARLKDEEPAGLVANWLRSADTVDFIYEWEFKYNDSFNHVEFDMIRNRAGRNAFRLSTKNLVDIGCIGIYAKAGRYGGTYAAIQWAIHFANWMDPAFYLATLDSYLNMQRKLYGEDATRLRFSRELAAKNYRLITQKNSTREIPQLPKPRTKDRIIGGHKKIVRRHLKQADADIINVAIWGMTAKTWRAKFGVNNDKVNMRDFAIAEELQVVSGLQHLIRNWQEDDYTQEEKLRRAILKAQELLIFYCDTDEKRGGLKAARKKRGW